MSEVTIFIISGLALLWLLIRAFFRWVDVRERAPERRPSSEAAAPEQRLLH